MEITYYGHACFGVKIGKNNLLFDPFITHNPLAADIDIKKIEADHLLISHAHNDHIGDALEIAKGQDPVLISNGEVFDWLKEKGIAKGYGMNHGGKIKRDFGTVRLVNAVHSSSFSDDTYGGNPAGFVIESGEGNFYFSYDSRIINKDTTISLHMRGATIQSFRPTRAPNDAPATIAFPTRNFFRTSAAQAP